MLDDAREELLAARFITGIWDRDAVFFGCRLSRENDFGVGGLERPRGQCECATNRLTMRFGAKRSPIVGSHSGPAKFARAPQISRPQRRTTLARSTMADPSSLHSPHRVRSRSAQHATATATGGDSLCRPRDRPRGFRHWALAFGFESYRTMEAKTKPMPRAILSDGIERVRTAASTVVATMEEGFAYAYRILSAYLNVAGI